MSNKIYALKRGAFYLTATHTDTQSGMEIPVTSVYVNNCKLLSKEEVRKYLDKFPDFQVAIINVINQES